jgi:hypothetical protein
LPIELACSGLPAGATCSFTASATGNPLNGVLTVKLPAGVKMGNLTFAVMASSSGLTASTQVALNVQASLTPGWWWDPSLSGIGFFIENGGVSGNGMFIGGYSYDAGGNGTWLVSTGQVNFTTYSGNWLKIKDGQTLTGAYQAPSPATSAGTLSITFSDSTHAVMWRPDGTSINLQKFSFTTNPPTPPIPGTPQLGWWWGDPSATGYGTKFGSGTGYGIEFQGNQVFIVAYVYDASGSPVWYLATGALTTPTSYSGSWDLYRGGPQLTSPEGTYSATKVTGASVPMLLTFSDATHGTLTMGSTTIPIVRFQQF